tara:strand:- start:12 stop:815 length:804 start_codon:yes stop_codon:yes gene_type:complete
MNQHILLIGCGNLGHIILNALTKKKRKLIVYEKQAKIQSVLQKNKKIIVIKKLSEINLYNIDYILLCIKPVDAINLLKQLKQIDCKESMIISFVAGLTMKKIEEMVDVKSVIRIMPNIFIEVQESATAIISNSKIKNLRKKIASDFSFFGSLIWLNKEEKIDFFTALYGGGPAYFFYFLNILVNLSQQNNISLNQSVRLVLSLLNGATKFIKKNGNNFPKLIKKVTSPKGTTEKAIEIFEKNNLYNIFNKAIISAEKRAKDLSERTS